VRKLIEETKKELEKALENSNTSPAHRARIRTKIEKLELVILDRHMEQINSFELLTTEELIKVEK
jgi:hypothetical protein